MAGKGDSPRPLSIGQEEYAKNFEAVFGHKPNWWETEEHQKWVEESQQEKDAVIDEANQ